MICSNCKRKLVNGSKYCPRCGYLFPSDDVRKYSYGIDYELTGYYIKNSRVVSIFGLSPFYFFFSFAYAFLKKVYYVGIYSFISDLLLIYLFKYGIGIVFGSIGFFFLPVIFLTMLTVFIHFYYSFKFNTLYIENVIYRISRIEKNNYKENEKIKEKCLKDGKNNYLVSILSIILFVLILIFKIL